MISINFHKPEISTNIEYMIIKKNKSLYRYSFIRNNISSMVDKIAIFYLSNMDKFILMKNIFKNKNHITVQVINWYCHRYETEWYIHLCADYEIHPGFGTPLSCLSIGEPIKWNLGSIEITAPLLTINFFTDLYTDNLYDLIVDHHEKLINDLYT